MGTDSSFRGFVEFDSWFNVMKFQIMAEAQDPARQEGFSWPDTRTTSALHFGDDNDNDNDSFDKVVTRS